MLISSPLHFIDALYSLGQDTEYSFQASGLPLDHYPAEKSISVA